MKKNPAIVVFIFMFICAALIAYAITCGIYFVKGFFEQKEIERQEAIRQEQIRIEKIKKEAQERKRLQEQNQNAIGIIINEPVALSYKSKEEILKLRKHYVEQSMFANPDYEPSNQVFGEIESGKPWNSMKQCKYKQTDKSDIDGPSEESRYINNPALLVGVEYAFYDYYCGDRRTEEIPYSKPIKIKYFKDEKTMEVVFGGLPYCTEKGRTWYNLKGINARDLGYKYAYIDKEKSTLDIEFVEETNASNSIIEFQDFIHVGGSCGHKGGCNNASPNQPPLNFYYSCAKDNGFWAKNKTIYITKHI